VTFVRLDSFNDNSREVLYSRTSGYQRVYSNGYSMVYGTGWHYPGHIHHNPYGYNSYWRYPYSYGYGAWYNPVYGRYGYRGAYGHYGYYGYNHSATYTVNRQEKDWKWDLEGDKRRVYEQGPRNYVGSGQYILPDGKRYRGENQSASRGKNSYTAANNGEDDLYSDQDGGIYRKTANGWQRYQGGGWREVSGEELATLERQYTARQAGYRNYDEYLAQKRQQ
jgi:hypothetical protein